MMAQQGGGSEGLTPDKAPDGVYIQDLYGLLYNIDNWRLPNEQANGVAVLDSRHPDRGFVVSKEKEIFRIWQQSAILINNILTTEDVNVAKTDFFGLSNTDKIIEQDSNATAAIYCKNHIFPNGKNGYLASLGELVVLYDNKENVEKCLIKIGGSSFDAGHYMSSSTQYSFDKVWTVLWDNGNVLEFLKHNPGSTRIKVFTTL